MHNFFMSQQEFMCMSVYTAESFFLLDNSRKYKHIVPCELGAHLPHTFRLQRPLQCLVWGGSLADLLPARDHSGAGRRVSAGFARRQKGGQDKLRFMVDLQGCYFFFSSPLQTEAVRLSDPTLSSVQ